MKSIDEILISVSSVVLIDGHHGIYVPQVFVEKYKADLILDNENLLEDIKIIESFTNNENDEDYINAWVTLKDQSQVILDNVAYALYTNENGDLIGYSIDEYNALSDDEKDALWGYLM